MTMTLADAARIDDGVVTPRADRPKRRTFTAGYKLRPWQNLCSMSTMHRLLRAHGSAGE
jgi:hypothetical protein